MTGKEDKRNPSRVKKIEVATKLNCITEALLRPDNKRGSPERGATESREAEDQK